MLEDIDVELGVDYFSKKDAFDKMADKIVYTGMIDEFYNYQFGKLEYRSLRFESEIHHTDNFQGNAVINYTDADTPYTRIIEHKHFEFGQQERTVITKEYPSEWEVGDEPYYPVNDEANDKLFNHYKALADKEKNVIFGGRLADYRYYDMHDVIGKALEMAEHEFVSMTFKTPELRKI